MSGYDLNDWDKISGVDQVWSAAGWYAATVATDEGAETPGWEHIDYEPLLGFVRTLDGHLDAIVYAEGYGPQLMIWSEDGKPGVNFVCFVHESQKGADFVLSQARIVDQLVWGEWREVEA